MNISRHATPGFIQVDQRTPCADLETTSGYSAPALSCASPFRTASIPICSSHLGSEARSRLAQRSLFAATAQGSRLQLVRDSRRRRCGPSVSERPGDPSARDLAKPAPRTRSSARERATPPPARGVARQSSGDPSPRALACALAWAPSTLQGRGGRTRRRRRVQAGRRRRTDAPWGGPPRGHPSPTPAREPLRVPGGGPSPSRRTLAARRSARPGPAIRVPPAAQGRCGGDEPAVADSS